MRFEKFLWLTIILLQGVIFIGTAYFAMSVSVSPPTATSLEEQQKTIHAIQSGQQSLSSTEQVNMLVKLGRLREESFEAISKARSVALSLIAVLGVCLLLEGWLFWNSFRRR